MQLAIDQRLISRDPTDGCALPRVEHREMKTLTAEQLTAFFIEAKNSSGKSTPTASMYSQVPTVVRLPRIVYCICFTECWISQNCHI